MVIVIIAFKGDGIINITEKEFGGSNETNPYSMNRTGENDTDEFYNGNFS